MADMAALLDQLVAIAKKNAAEFEDSQSKQEAVEAFIKRSKALTPLKTSLEMGLGARTNATSRVDCRSNPFCEGDVFDVPADTNIYASSRFHVHAAVSLGGAANRASGWGVGVQPSDSKEAFEELLKQLLGAPHWLLERFLTREVQHHSSNHAKFTEDLVTMVSDVMGFVNAGERAITAATDSVKSLATLLSNNVGSSINETLYVVLGISRDHPTAPVFYSIFFMELQMRHNTNGKSTVLSNSAVARAYMLRLDSLLLMRFADMYHDIEEWTVERWLRENALQ